MHCDRCPRHIVYASLHWTGTEWLCTPHLLGKSVCATCFGKPKTETWHCHACGASNAPTLPT